MSNSTPVWKRAIKESVGEFVLGVHSHNPKQPDVTIPEAVVNWLENHPDVEATFKGKLKGKPNEWDAVGPQVCRAAFHGGSLAALHAYTNGTMKVTRDDVKRALGHIKHICDARFGARWVYCPWAPWP